MYEWAEGDPRQRLDALHRGLASGAVDVSPTLSTGDLRGYVYLPISERIVGQA